MKKPPAVAQLVRVPVTELISAIRHRFDVGSWTAEDVNWLIDQAKAAARMKQAIASWHEDWDNRYDGEPLKDYEIQMLKILGKQ